MINIRSKTAALCLLHLLVLTAGCGGTDLDPADLKPSPSIEASPGAAGILVSPETFELASRWMADSLKPDGVSAASKPPMDGLDLVAYARRHAPELYSEAAALQSRLTSSPLEIQEMQNVAGCTCQILGAFDVPTNNLSGNDPNGHWSMNITGAAHSASIYNAKSGSSTETSFNSAVYKTQFRTRLMCATPTGQACVGGCSAKFYADVRYSTQITAAADTGGIWAKGAMAQLADGATLSLTTPSGGSTAHLFEKAVSVSHYANKTTFDPKALAQLLKGVLSIGASIFSNTDNPNNDGTISGQAIDDTVSGFFGLRHHEGDDGSTTQGLVVDFEPPTWQPITVSYSSTNNLYYSLNLATSVQMRVRGYGGWHRGNGDLASSYSIAAYFDNFVCDAQVTTPPARTAFWRYDGYNGAAVSVSSLRERVGNFFYLAFGVRPNVTNNQGELGQGTCGDGVCGGLESDISCAVDCVRCGDNRCSQGESVHSCPGDCGSCGDGYCSSIEDIASCVDDCGSCGDGYCSTHETVYSCAEDCAYCGDGLCSMGESWCTQDCGSCLYETRTPEKSEEYRTPIPHCDPW